MGRVHRWVVPWVSPCVARPTQWKPWRPAVCDRSLLGAFGPACNWADKADERVSVQASVPAQLRLTNGLNIEHVGNVDPAR
jgi:hypothetical protein